APAIRVALRNLKDFAVPLTVSQGDKKEIFWRWYLLSNQEATVQIQNLLETLPKEPKPLPKEPEPLAKQPEQIAPKPVQEIKKEIQEEITRPKELKKNLFEEEKKKIEEEKRKLEQEKSKILEQEKRLKQLNLERENLLKEKERRLEEERQTLLREQQKKKQEEQRMLLQKKKEQEDPFFTQIMTYLESKKIEVLDYNIIKKKKEIDLRVKVPSVIGKLDYLCKAKKKRKISDTYINAIFVEGQIKKIPVLFLTTGTLSKNAVEKLTNEFKGVMVDKLE
ncbi:hypothetical protein KY317_03845, partial [Candidatus Woesearchaeota archaeon]|nr:hypothetical protein [Candidatus Woesearchaeota archaeon]